MQIDTNQQQFSPSYPKHIEDLEIGILADWLGSKPIQLTSWQWCQWSHSNDHSSWWIRDDIRLFLAAPSSFRFYYLPIFTAAHSGWLFVWFSQTGGPKSQTWQWQSLWPMAWQLAVRVYGQLLPSSGSPPTRALGLVCCERMLSFAGQCISCAVLFGKVQQWISVLSQETDKTRNHIYYDLCTSRLLRQCWIHLLQHKSKRWFPRTKLETGYTIIWINPYDNSDQELVRAKHSKVLLLDSEEGHAAVHLNWSDVKKPAGRGGTVAVETVAQLTEINLNKCNVHHPWHAFLCIGLVQDSRHVTGREQVLKQQWSSSNLWKCTYK
jgi:hypothetical protein